MLSLTRSLLLCASTQARTLLSPHMVARALCGATLSRGEQPALACSALRERAAHPLEEKGNAYIKGPLKLLAEKQAAHPIGDEICIGSVFFSHDGSNVISVGRSDGTLKVWGLRPFDEAEWEEKHGLFPIDEETSLDPKPISYWENIVTGDLRRARTVDPSDPRPFHSDRLATLELLAEVSAHRGKSISGSALSEDGKSLASSTGQDQTIKVWDTRVLRPVVESEWEQFEMTIKEQGFDDRMEPWWRHLPTGHEQAERPDTAVLDLRIITNTEGFRALAFAPDGKLVSASTDCIAIWEARAYDASEWEQVEGPFPGAVDFCEEPDKSVVKYWRNTVTDDVRREKSSAATLKLVSEIQGCGNTHALAVSPDGSRIAATSMLSTNAGSIRVYDAGSLPHLCHVMKFLVRSKDSLELLSETLGDFQYINCLSFSPDGNILISGSESRVLKLWDLTNPRAFDEEEWEQTHGLFPGDDEFFPGVERTSYWINRQTGDARREQSHAATLCSIASITDVAAMCGGVQSVDYHPDGSKMVSGAGKGRLKVWAADSVSIDESDWEEIRGDFPVRDERMPDYEVTYWKNKVTGELRLDNSPGTLQLLAQDEEAHVALVTSVAFSPDGTKIASASGFGELLVWDLSSDA